MHSRRKARPKTLPDSQDSRSLLRGRVLSLSGEQPALAGAEILAGEERYLTAADGTYDIPLDGHELPIRLTISAPGYFQRVDAIDWTPILPGGLLLRDFYLLENKSSHYVPQSDELDFIVDPDAPTLEAPIPGRELQQALESDMLLERMNMVTSDKTRSAGGGRQAAELLPRSSAVVPAPAASPTAIYNPQKQDGTYTDSLGQDLSAALPPLPSIEFLLDKLVEQEEQILVAGNPWSNGTGEGEARDTSRARQDDPLGDDFQSLLGGPSPRLEQAPLNDDASFEENGDDGGLDAPRDFDPHASFDPHSAFDPHAEFDPNADFGTSEGEDGGQQDTGFDDDAESWAVGDDVPEGDDWQSSDDPDEFSFPSDDSDEDWVISGSLGGPLPRASDVRAEASSAAARSASARAVAEAHAFVAPLEPKRKPVQEDILFQALGDDTWEFFATETPRESSTAPIKRLALERHPGQGEEDLFPSESSAGISLQVLHNVRRDALTRAPSPQGTPPQDEDTAPLAANASDDDLDPSGDDEDDFSWAQPEENGDGDAGEDGAWYDPDFDPDSDF